MSTTVDKQRYFEMISSVRDKRDQLPSESQIRRALSDELLSAVEQHVTQTPKQDLLYAYWPPVFGLVDSFPMDVLGELDADLNLVIDTAGAAKEKELTQFLNTRSRDKPGPWYGGLFDIWAKCTALKSGLPVEMDYVLPNGRDHDILLEVEGRSFHLENTVITQDDEAREVWDRFLQDKRLDPEKILIRPGAYCPLDAKGPSPYYDALRLYAKVYDKLAKDLDPAKTQCADNEPNVLLISFSGSGVRADSPSIGWVFGELFADQPKMVRTVAPDGWTDISLDAWIDFTAKHLISRGKMTTNFFCDRFSDIMGAPRRLGAVMLFDGCKLIKSRVNYNADEGSEISHREIVALESHFEHQAPYWI